MAWSKMPQSFVKKLLSLERSWTRWLTWVSILNVSKCQCRLLNVGFTVYVTAPQMTTDPKYTSEAHRAAAADENAPEGTARCDASNLDHLLTITL